MVDDTLAHEEVGLSGRAFATVLFMKYAALTLYGVWAAITEIPTFVNATSSAFAVLWAASVAACAAFAAVGVGRTWLTGRYRLERWATFAFVCAFPGYSVALAYQSITHGRFDSLPLAIIPIALCFFPGVRYFRLVRLAHAAQGRRDG